MFKFLTRISVVMIMIFVVSYTHAKKKGSTVWVKSAAQAIETSPWIDNGKVYYGSLDKYMYCADAKDGKLIWRFETEGRIKSGPVVFDGKVFFGSHDGNLYCLDANKGYLIWKYKSEQVIVSSPCVFNGKVYFGDYGKVFHCLDIATGKEIWNYKMKRPVFSSPTVVGGMVYFGGLDRRMHCLNSETGEKHWGFITGSSIKSSPLVKNGRVYFGSEDKKFYCLDAKNGGLIWVVNLNLSGYTGADMEDGKIFVGSYDKQMICLNAKDGKTIWKYNTEKYIKSSPLVVGGVVYFGGTGDHKFYALDMNTGKKLWTKSMDHPESSPAIADGKIYIGDAGNIGILRCIESGQGNISKQNSLSGQVPWANEFIKPTKPPRLDLTATVNIGRDKILKAGETGKITMTIKNTGKGRGENLSVSVKKIKGTTGISYDIPNNFSIDPNESKSIVLKIKAGELLETGHAIFEVLIKEPFYQRHSNPLEIKVQTLELLKPDLVLNDWGVDDDKKGDSRGNNNKIVEEGEDIEFEVIIANQGAGMAYNVSIMPKIVNNTGINYIGEKSTINVGDIPSGDWRKVKIPVVIGRNLKNKNGNITIEIYEDRGYGENVQAISFKVGAYKEIPRKIVVEKGKLNIIKNGGVSDIDKDIPEGKSPYKSAIAVVIGNKDYKNGIAAVDYALNDARAMKNYFITRFAVDKKNIIYYENAGLSTFIALFGTKDVYKKSKLYRFVQRVKPEVVYVYYSGHGIPGLSDKKGYLAPVDVARDNTEMTAFSIDLFYKNLAYLKNELGVKRVVIMLEACFSGDSPKGMIIENISPITAKVKNPLLVGELGIIFSATSGDNYATWYKEKQHGTFSYYLMKGLRGAADKDKNKKITLGELREYLLSKVPEQANIQSAIEQTPEVKGKSEVVIVED